MRAYTTTFLLTLIILLITSLTSATPAPVDRRFELATPGTPQAFAEKFSNLVERVQHIYPRGKKSSGGSDSSDAGANKVTGLGFMVAGAAVAALAL